MRRRGLSLIEALLAAVLFVVLLVPVVLIYGSSNRVGYAADRMLDATLHGQTLLESLAALEDHELPPVPAGASVPLFVDDPDAALWTAPAINASIAPAALDPAPVPTAPSSPSSPLSSSPPNALAAAGAGRLLLARDPFGQKPLFVARRGDDLVFGSELKSLLVHPAVELAVDPLAAGRYAFVEKREAQFKNR